MLTRDQVIKGAQEKPEYKRSISSIVGLFKKYAHKAEAAAKETADKSNVSDEDEKVQQAGRDMKAFIEKITNKPLDDVIKASQKVSFQVSTKQAYKGGQQLIRSRPRTTSERTTSSRSTLTTWRTTSTDSCTSRATLPRGPLTARPRACSTTHRPC